MDDVGARWGHGADRAQKMVHSPARHALYGKEHDRPQPPQLEVSTLRLRHRRSEHRVVPGAHVWHWPPLHSALREQYWPQPPQFRQSRERSVQVLEFWLHRPKPMGHESHSPFLQTRLRPWVVGQRLPQDPQLSGSVAMLTQRLEQILAP